MRIAVVGDCVFDVSVRPSGPLSGGGDVPAEIHLLPGGQAANVAVRLARRGIRVRLISPLADDPAGRLLRDRLKTDGVELAAMRAERTGHVVAILDPGGERTMLSDRAPFPRGVTVRHELQRQLAGADWVHVSGYALLDASGADAVVAAVAALPASVVRSVDSDSLPPDDATVVRFAERVRASRAVLLFAGRAEAEALARRDGDRASASVPEGRAGLAQLASTIAHAFGLGVIVTGGASGSAARLATLGLTVPAYAPTAAVLDTTGSGDAYAAAVIAELAAERWPPSGDALRRAMLAGSELGSRVARVRGAQGIVLGEAAAGIERHAVEAR